MDAAVFEAHRGLLFAIAYRMLGVVADAEDVVQDVYLRSREAEDVRDPKAYLVTAASRASIDALRSARRRRERYVGPWLPEPLVGAVPDASEDVELAESLSFSFLVVLETLSPVERAAFLLRDVFSYPYREIAAILEREEAASRQLVHRARGRLSAGNPRFDAPPDKHRELLRLFLRACTDGDVGSLERLLRSDAAVYSDGGGEVRAARAPVLGAGRAARFLVNLAQRAVPLTTTEIAGVNGRPGVILRTGGRPLAVIAIEASEAGVERVYIVAAPTKLRSL